MGEFAAESFRNFAVTLFGYWETDDAALTDTQRAQAQETLYETAAALAAQGVPTEVRLEHGPAADRDRRLERVTVETDADATLRLTRIPVVKELLVPIKDDRNASAIVDAVAAFDPDELLEVTFYHATEEPTEDGESMLRELRSELVERGFPDPIVTTDVETTDDELFSVGRRADEADLVVMGATEEHDAADRIFGTAAEYVADESDSPVLVVR